MALTVAATRLVRVAEGTIWRRWRALDEWPRWRPEIVASRWNPGVEQWAENSRFVATRRVPLPFIGARQFDGTVRSVVEEQLLVYELMPTTASWLGPILVESVRLEPAPSGTNVVLTLSAHGAGATLLGPLLRGPLQRQVAATLDGLQDLLAPAERRL